MKQQNPAIFLVPFDQLPDSALVRLNQLIASSVVPFSVSTVWRRIREGKFPQPIRLSARAIAFRVGEVRDWSKCPDTFSATSVSTEPVLDDSISANIQKPRRVDCAAVTPISSKPGLTHGQEIHPSSRSGKAPARAVEDLGSIQRRANLEIVHWIESMKISWYQLVIRISPPKSMSNDSIKSRLIKSLQWTLAEVRRQRNENSPCNFVPMWGGNPKTGVGIHIHAILEIPRKQETVTDFKDFFELEFSQFSAKKFRTNVNPQVYVEPVVVTHSRPIQHLVNYSMRSEGAYFGSGTEKLITELLHLSKR